MSVSDFPVCLSMCLVLSHLLVHAGAYRTQQEDNFYRMAEQRFRSATPEELIRIWHTDCHRRCRWVLPRHIEMACQFDPYRIENTLPEERRRRSTDSASEELEQKYNMDRYVKRLNKTKPLLPSNSLPSFTEDADQRNPFITKADASKFLSTQTKPLRRSKRGITDECCFEKPCSWEEYGEYCHDYVRGWYVRQSDCS